MNCGVKATNYDGDIDCENRPDNFSECVAGPYIPDQSLREDQISTSRVHNCALINGECERDVFDNNAACQNALEIYYDSDNNGTVIIESPNRYLPVTTSEMPPIPVPSSLTPVTTPSSDSSGLSGGAIAGIVIGSIVFLLLIIWMIKSLL